MNPILNSLNINFGGLVLICIGFALIIYDYKLKQKIKESLSWTITKGKITHSEVIKDTSDEGVIYKSIIEYDYYIGGLLYKGKTICIGGELDTSFKDRAIKRCDKYPLEASVNVYYDPKKPQNACLEREGEGIGILYYFGVFIVLIGLFLF